MVGAGRRMSSQGSCTTGRPMVRVVPAAAVTLRRAVRTAPVVLGLKRRARGWVTKWLASTRPDSGVAVSQAGVLWGVATATVHESVLCSPMVSVDWSA